MGRVQRTDLMILAWATLLFFDLQFSFPFDTFLKIAPTSSDSLFTNSSKGGMSDFVLDINVKFISYYGKCHQI